MALTDEGNGMVMPVAPMYGNGFGGGHSAGLRFRRWRDMGARKDKYQ